MLEYIPGPLHITGYCLCSVFVCIVCPVYLTQMLLHDTCLQYLSLGSDRMPFCTQCLLALSVLCVRQDTVCTWCWFRFLCVCIWHGASGTLCLHRLSFHMTQYCFVLDVLHCLCFASDMIHFVLCMFVCIVWPLDLTLCLHWSSCWQRIQPSDWVVI